MANQDENFYIPHTFSLPKTSKLNEEIIQQFDHIMDFASSEEYRDTLIEIYHMYISHEHDCLPSNFKQMAGQMYFLIDFFRRVGEEMKGGRVDTTTPEYGHCK
jgi:hypothetical protein